MRLPIVVAIMGLVAFPVQADDATQGRALVSTYCAVCHNIERAGDSPNNGAPPFRTLHERYDLDGLREALVKGLVIGHPAYAGIRFRPRPGGRHRRLHAVAVQLSLPVRNYPADAALFEATFPSI